MRVLLLVYGEYRSADISTKTWNILSEDVDVVVHTQNESKQRISKYDIYESKNIREEDIFSIFGDTCKLYLEPLDEFERVNPNKDIHLNVRSFRFLYNQVKDNILNYDIVAISRLDSTFYIHDLERFKTEYNKDVLYVNEKIVDNGESKFIQDHCFFGSSYIIDSFLKNLPTTIEKSHSEIAEYIYNNFQHDTWENFSSIHLRLNMKEIFKKFFDKNGRCSSKDDKYLEFYKLFIEKMHFILEQEIK
jgi:hypothetical protein